MILEIDAHNLARALKLNDFDRVELGVIFREIKTKMAFGFNRSISKCYIGVVTF